MLSAKNLGSLNPSDFKLVPTPKALFQLVPTPNSLFKLVPKPKMLFPLQFFRLVAILQMLESIILDFGEEMQRLVKWASASGNLGLRILWLFLHLAVSIWFFLVGIVQYFESFLIASDIFKKYEALDISKVRYLAVVIDSGEARQISKVFELLEWLVDIGVRNVCLYDPDGVLKKYKEAITDRFSSTKVSEESSTNGAVATDRNLTLEFVSFSDGKEAVVKAANYLFTKHYTNGDKEKTDFTEPQMGEALAAIGSGGPEPDLLLIYGPIRCHLGFPAWRLRYTEIVHMGSLKSMKYGALVKAIYKYTMVRQNYGS
ncbi:OLC1v1003174C5 [Oldenlandia corymbosa var. corymbosa]|uniref:ditrans,polycis-polyprenyl diphosphate synthase [(2E,6E)-farnesyldiphosphate specific] n=2 Tax=Oldenlandia corymbosa var. corymbosa TaxID=529605 RepID=A0AAV1DCA0_OLDCO|nr:OLC1v1003174C5 [Oldenlandia corymbosa var. corymbosa]